MKTASQNHPVNSSFRAVLYLLLGALGSVFLAGGPREGGMGLFLLVAGSVLLLMRPAQPVSWSLWLLGILLLLSVSLSLLPEHFAAIPSWREALHRVPELNLTDHVSLDPYSTAFWVVLLGMTLGIGFFLLGSPLEASDMEKIGLVAVLGCTLYAVLAWFAWQTGWHYPFFVKEEGYPDVYGFFPNRNHTAGFLLSGAVLSIGLLHRGISKGRFLTILLSAISFSILVSALLVFSHSRGGLLFLLAGGFVWLCGLGRYRSRLLLAGSILLFLITLFLFLGSGSALLERLKGMPDEAASSVVTPGDIPAPTNANMANPFSDARLAIARDTIGMIGRYPLTGTGFGTYAIVYPFHADKSLRDKTTALHAESDWLMMASEGGLPALLLVLVALAMLMRGIPGLYHRSSEDWPLRWAFLSAFFAELLHGIVDVPLHRVELGWWILLMGGIGFAARRDALRATGFRLQRCLLGVAGVAMIVAGLFMLRAQWLGGRHVPPFESRGARMAVLRQYAYANPSTLKPVFEECRRLLGRYPMNGPLYYQYGIFLVEEHKELPLAEALFRVARRVAPHDADLAFEQGLLLSGSDPKETARLWKEALERQLELDQVPNCPVRRTSQLFYSMISSAASNAGLRSLLPELSKVSPETRIAWLTSPSADPKEIQESVEDRAFMSKISSKDQGSLFEAWWQRGDKKAVGDFLIAHPEYEKTAVATKASMFAASGNEKEACELLIRTFGIPLPHEGDGKAIQSASDDVPSNPLAAAKYYLDRGNQVTARRLLAQADSDPEHGLEVLLLRAQVEMSSGNWHQALPLLITYLHASKEL